MTSFTDTGNIHIAVVDDEPDIRETVQEYLELKGFQVSMAADAAQLRRLLTEQPIDLVVLDISMPGEDGLSLARYLHEHTSIYVIMLTAAGNVVDRIIGLEVGADDYLAKPVDLRELHARIRALLRRVRPASEPAGTSEPGGAVDRAEVWFGHCRLSLAEHKLYDARGEEIPLTTMEFDLLKAFAGHPDQLLSREQLFTLAHDRDWDPFDRCMDLRISRLRRKIEADPAKPQVIKTVHGAGYRFVQIKSAGAGAAGEENSG
jgi:two-component system phosphate regulon response regulator OmpR